LGATNTVRSEMTHVDRSVQVPRDSVAVPHATKRDRTAKGPGTGGGQWRVLETGVLATPTSIEVVTACGRRRIWCDPRGGGRLVCEHGWGAYHLSAWNGPRAHRFPKPSWTTCDCRGATGLSGGRRNNAKRRRGDCEPGEVATQSGGESGESDHAALGSSMQPLPYYDVLVGQHGTTELRTDLHGVRVPGVVGTVGEPFYMVKGDATNVLRCRHGHTTNTLTAQERERRRHAASLVVAALLGPGVARKALGCVAGPEAAATSHRMRRVLVRLLQTLHAAREGRRARRGAPLACGCTPVHVKACVVKGRRQLY
jgi:hypothetical protein